MSQTSEFTAILGRRLAQVSNAVVPIRTHGTMGTDTIDTTANAPSFRGRGRGTVPGDRVTGGRGSPGSVPITPKKTSPRGGRGGRGASAGGRGSDRSSSSRKKSLLENLDNCVYDEVHPMDEEITDDAWATGSKCYQPCFYPDHNPDNDRIESDHGFARLYNLLDAEEKREYDKRIPVTAQDIERIAKYKQRSPEWHDERIWRIGGSEAAGLLGISRYKTQLESVRAKVKEPGTEFHGNDNTERGTINEDPARKRILRDLQQRVRTLLNIKLRKATNILEATEEATADSKKEAVEKLSIQFRYFGLKYSIPEEIIQAWRDGTLSDTDCLAELPEKGGLIHHEFPMVSASSDGAFLLFRTYVCNGLEIKWPAKTKNDPYPFSLMEHYAQIQLTGYIHGFSLMLYASFSTGSYTITPFWINTKYCERYLLPTLMQVYMTQVLPRLVLRQKRLRQAYLESVTGAILSTSSSSSSSSSSTSATSLFKSVAESCYVSDPFLVEFGKKLCWNSPHGFVNLDMLCVATAMAALPNLEAVDSRGIVIPPLKRPIVENNTDMSHKRQRLIVSTIVQNK